MLPKRLTEESDAEFPTADQADLSKAPSHWTFYIPNALTVCRILLAIVFPVASDSMRPWIVVVALLTEFLDGALSRWLHAQTLLGQILDPIADKLFFGSVVVTFWIKQRLSLFELFLLGIRDLAVICSVGYSIFQGNWHYIKSMRPKFFGKLVTALQYGAFINLIFVGCSVPPNRVHF